MLPWIQQFSLFLFDFDGLLVNTEIVHFKAYQETLKTFGLTLPWDFPQYVQIAHFKAEGIEEGVYREFPELKKREPLWKNIYEIKKEIYLRLLKKERIEWMPYAQELLLHLKAQEKKCVVVTHSDRSQVSLISSKIENLSLISHWITREDYAKPKPEPDCYRLAIAKYAKESDRVVGFEDSPRGLKALLGTKATPVLVTEISYKEIDSFKKQGVMCLSSFENLFKT